MKENALNKEHNINASSEVSNSISDRTPMFKALNAERYGRQTLIKKIQEKTKNHLICYVATQSSSLTREDSIGFAEVLYNIPRNSSIDLLINSPGGDIDAAEKIVSMLRATVGKGILRIIVPDFAKSAGTLIALAADKIVMSDSSELGPIDPQFVKKDSDGNQHWHSILNYLSAYDKLSKELKDDPNNLPAKMMFSKFDATTVELFEAIKQRARTLAEEHLNRWMFQHKKATYTKIAGDLMDLTKWPAHGQMISWEDAKQMELEVEYFEPDDKLWKSYWELYCFQRLAIKDHEKLFESEHVSLPM